MPDMLIESNAALAAFCETLTDEPAIFLDTEFVGEFRYYSQLGSVQVGTATHAALVDPLKVSDFRPLARVLAKPDCTKVFHAAGQDLTLLNRLLDLPLAPVFDTQIAAQLLTGDEQIGFSDLVQRVTGSRPAAGHGFTNWLARPLTPGQIDYALDDVRCLVAVYEHQRNELDTRGRTAWAREEFGRLEDPARYIPADPEQAYLRVKGGDRLNGGALAILQALASWRERTARLDDVPTGRVARDEVLVELAMRPVKSLRPLRELRGLTQQQVNQYGEALLNVIAVGREQPPPPRRRRVTVPAELDPTVDFLGLCLHALAAAKTVAPTAVATRGDLHTLVLNGPEADIPLLRGWRRQEFGAGLLAALAGEATARIVPGTGRVELVWAQADSAAA